MLAWADPIVAVTALIPEPSQAALIAPLASVTVEHGNLKQV